MTSKPKPKEVTPKLQVEALLFSSGRTMSEEQLATLAKLDPHTVKSALTKLQEEYGTRDSAITLFNDPTGWKMMIRELYVPTVKNIVADTELTRACMETLAIIAYKYPKVLQSEVIDIRGSGAYEHMAELEHLGFIVRTPEKRSYAVKLTEKFFSYFDVAGGKDIREVFKNVKVPKRVVVDAQKTLGDLQIIDVQKGPNAPGEHHGKTVDGLAVVDVPPPSVPQIIAEEQAEESSPEPEAPEDHSGFLDDLDQRIAQLRQRNDDTEKDPAFQRKQLPGMEAAQETQTRDASQDDEKKSDSGSNS